jgi:hypothetical protein
MLENRADAERDRIARGAYGDPPATDADGTSVGAQDTREYPDQRRLAGAVFAEQDVHFPSMEIE